MNDDFDPIQFSLLIQEQEEERLKAVAKQQQRDRRQQPYSAYLGTNSEGQALVRPLGSTGVTASKALSNAQPSMGQLGRGFTGGYDAGQVRSPQIEIYGQTTYPFKTLWFTDNNKIWRGGDIIPIRLNGDMPNFTFYGQIVNSGKLSGWEASYTTATLAKIRFLLPSTPITSPIEKTILANSNPFPIGGGYWLDRGVASPFITTTRTTISGNPPPSTGAQFSVVNPESGSSDTGAYNFSVRYDQVAALSSNLPKWAPYDAGSISIGAKIWTQSTLYNGAAGNGVGIYRWQNLDHNERIEGDRRYPVRVFAIDINTVNPAPGYVGESRQFDDTTVHTTQTRATDFSSINLAKTVDQTILNSTLVTIPFVGTQQRQYSVIASTRIISSMTDVRSAGAGGTNGTYNFSETKTYDNRAINPLLRPLRGDRICLVIEETTGNTQTVQKNETKTAACGTVTETFRPAMQQPVFGLAGYIVSAAITDSGPLGGWHAGGGSGQSPSLPGEPRLTDLTIYRRGVAWDASQATGWFYGADLGSSDGGMTWFSATNFFGNRFDSSYNDNGTTSTVYTEVTYTKTLSASSIYDLGIASFAEYNWTFSKSLTTTDTTTYPSPRSYFLLTETETLTIDPEPFILVADIDPAAVSASNSAIVINSASSLGITTQTSLLKKKEIVTTENLEYFAGSVNPSRNTIHTATEYTSDPINHIGQKVEIYLLSNGAITQWQGTVTALSGSNTPDVPLASGSTEAGRTFSNTFVGPYPQTVSVRNVAIAVSSVAVIPFTPFAVAENYYTLVINPDFALMADRHQSIRQVRAEPLTSYKFANIRPGQGSTIASIAVANKDLYKPGKPDYVCLWDIKKQQDGKCKLEKRAKLGKGSTRPNTGVTGGEAIAIQYFG